MLIEINPNMELPYYKLVLCKLNGEEIAELHNVTNKIYKPFFADIDELTFNVSKYRSDNQGEAVENEIYDLVEGDFLIKLSDVQYFYIDNVKEIKTDKGEVYKEIHCYSGEYELSNKTVRGYSAISRKLYDHLNLKDEDGLEIGIMNYIETLTTWKVGSISNKLLDKYRGFDFTRANLLQVFQEIQKSFDCIFKFDTIHKVINIYEISELGQNKGLFISDENFVKSVSKDIKHDEIKTRLYLYGKDDLSIHRINLTGLPYIENYDFFKSEKYMSKGLIGALNRYDTLLETKKGEFSTQLTILDDLNSQLATKSDELVELNTQLKTIQSNLDVAISDNQPTNIFRTQENNKKTEITTKESEIKTLEGQINTVKNKIETLRKTIDLSVNLTPEQIGELDPFVRIDEFTDSNYTEENLYELLEKGKDILKKVSQPPISFSVNVVDFFNLVECQHMWDKIVNGDIINLKVDDLNIDWEIRLIGYTHDVDSNNLTLQFSNRNNIYDPNMYLADLIEDMQTTSTQVDYSKFKWNKAEDAHSSIAKYVNSQLDLSKQQILTATNQKPILDERGLWLTKTEINGSISPEQIRGVNNCIALTKDAWNTVDVAITPRGAVKDKIYCKKWKECV